MAKKGFKPTNGFNKDPERARLAGRKSNKGLSEEVKYLRAQTTNDIEATVYKYINASIDDLKVLANDGSINYLDGIIIATMIKGLEFGDFGHLEPILARSVGKVSERIQISGKVETYKELRVRMEAMSEEDATQKYFEMLKLVGGS